MRREDAALHYGGADHEEAMAMERIFFGAHQDYVLVLQKTEKPIQGFFEIGRLAASCIVDQTVRPVMARIQRSATELVSEELINDLGGSELRHQGFAVELRKAKTARAAADVAHDIDFMPNEDTEKVGHFEVGVADGKQTTRVLRG